MDDAGGNASLEFITAGMILLLPMVYLVVALAAVQGGAFAVEGAARQAARVYVQAPDVASATVAAQRAVDFALSDYGLAVGTATIQIRCRPTPANCLTRQGLVSVTVRTEIRLPLVPATLPLKVHSSIPLQASASQRVSRFWGMR
ncbi:MAG: hypothetical protein H7248_00485 [Microbacteriaceae bacterium]|nr:hypothetical protein [Microbacteriaceae bacterium]